MSYLRAVIAVAFLGATIVAMSCGDGDGNGDRAADVTTRALADIEGKSVDVLGIWGSEELPNFRALVQPWQDETGAEMSFAGSRGMTALLASRVANGNPPDIAIPAEIGLFQQFAREGALVPLSECGLEENIRDDYGETFIDLGRVDGRLYGFFMKADTKGSVWYSPRTFKERGYEALEADASWQDLLALTTQIRIDGLAPWSIGVASEADSGWPGSDWIQQIILNMDDGPELYDGLVEGSIPFTDSRVEEAWKRFGEIALTEGNVSQGSPSGINVTNFQAATYPPFEDPPGAAMTYLGAFASTFISSQFPDAIPGEDYDFFTFPGGGITGAANIVYAFNNEPATCSLLRHLADAEAQQIWVEAGGFTSVNQQVELESYPNDTARTAAAQLLEADPFRFDLDDAIGGTTQQAIFAGITEYIDDPSMLDSILERIEKTRN